MVNELFLLCTIAYYDAFVCDFLECSMAILSRLRLYYLRRTGCEIVKRMKRATMYIRSFVCVVSFVCFGGVSSFVYAAGMRERALSKAVNKRRYKNIKRLLRLGADPNFPIGENQLSLLLSMFNDELHYSPKHFRAVTALLKANADPNVVGPTGDTALHTLALAEKDYPEMVQLLIAYGANVAATNKPNNRTPLHCAAKKCTSENRKIIRILLNSNADPEAADAHQNTPLHIAAVCGNIGVVIDLIRAGGNPSATNKAGKTPLDVVQEAIFMIRWGQNSIGEKLSMTNEGTLVVGESYNGDVADVVKDILHAVSEQSFEEFSFVRPFGEDCILATKVLLTNPQPFITPVVPTKNARE